MFMPRPCGCKGIRTCLVCEAELGVSATPPPVDIGSSGTQVSRASFTFNFNLPIPVSCLRPIHQFTSSTNSFHLFCTSSRRSTNIATYVVTKHGKEIQWHLSIQTILVHPIPSLGSSLWYWFIDNMLTPSCRTYFRLKSNMIICV